MRKSDYLPRVFINFIKRMQCNNYLYYSGSYCTWNEADEAVKKYGKGYESDNIIKQVAEATQAVRRGEAEYEQDGKLYYETNNVYEFLASLFYVISNSERVEICDFGGALGSTFLDTEIYCQCIKFPGMWLSKNIMWNMEKNMYRK